MDNHTLRKLQLTQLEIAKEIKRICDKNGINYSLAYGTMLGAVRHGGFIPWDDDMDIIMPYEDYLKFIEVSKTDMDPKYSFIEWNTSKYYPQHFGKVVKNGTKYHEQSYSNKSVYGIFVDVFPILPLPNSEEDRVKMEKKATYCRALIRCKCKLKIWNINNSFNVKTFIKYLPFRFIALFRSKESLIAEYDAIVAKSFGEKTNFWFADSFKPRECFKTEFLHEYTDIDFEGCSFKCLKNTDAILTGNYGDYMQLPPVEERGINHTIVEIDFGEENA